MDRFGFLALILLHNLAFGQERVVEEVILGHGETAAKTGDGHVLGNRIEYRRSTLREEPRTNYTDDRTYGLSEISFRITNDFYASPKYKHPGSETPLPTPAVEQNTLDEIKLGFHMRDWAAASPNDFIKPFIEGDLSLNYRTSSSTATGEQLQNEIHPDTPVFPGDLEPISCQRLGLVSEINGGARFDVGPVGLEGTVGFATDSVAFDRGYFRFASEVTARIAGPDLLDKRNPYLEAFAKIVACESWEGGEHNQLDWMYGLRGNIVGLTFEGAVSGRPQVNESYTKGLDTSDETRQPFYSVSFGLAF